MEDFSSESLWESSPYATRPFYKKLESEMGTQGILTAHCDVVVAVKGFQTPLCSSLLSSKSWPGC